MRGVIVWQPVAQILALRHSPVVQSGSALIASSVASSGLGFLYWAIAARMLPVATVGVASALISAMMLVTSLSLCGLNFAASRFLPVAGSRRGAMVHGLQIAAGGLGAAGGAIFMAGSAIWSAPAAQVGLPFVAAAACCAIFTIQDHVLLGLNRAAWVAIGNALVGIAKLALLIGLVSLLARPSWAIIFWPWVATAACAAVIVWVLAASHARALSTAASSLPSVWAICRFALANHFGAILLQLPPLIFPIVVYQMLGQEATAYFYTSWMLASMVMLLASNIASALVAQAARAEARADRTQQTALRYVMLLVVPGSILLLLGGRAALAIFGPAYQHGYALLITLALGCPVYALNAFYAGLMRVRRALRPVLIQGALAGGVALGLAPLLGSSLGLPGFGLAYVLGQIVAASLLLAPLARDMGRMRRRAEDGARSPQPAGDIEGSGV